MKKLALLIATSIAAASVNAAPVSNAVFGSIDNWRSWNAASKLPVPYAVAAAGLDLSQADNSGDSTLTAPAIGLHIDVLGSITYDDVTGVVSALTLIQTGSWTGWYDTDGDTFADDSITVSGLQWTLSGSHLTQTAGSVSGCASSSPVCAFTVAGIICQSIDCGETSSVFDFAGINAGFKTLPRSNATDTTYGSHHYKTWAATAGASGVATILPGGIADISMELASQVDGGAIAVNNANLASLNLYARCATEDGLCTYPEPVVMPIPSSIWLLGSGLIGLAGLKRRKR